MRRSHLTLAAFVGILLLMTALGARKLNADGVWADEWWSMYVAGADVFGEPLTIPQVWARITNEDPWQGVLYATLLSTWGRLVGWSEYALRTMSLLAGALAVAVMFQLGRTVSGSRLVGLGTAATFALSAWLIYFLHEMRVYTVLILFVAVLLLAYYRIMELGRPRWFDYALLVIATGALLNSHYYTTLVIGAVGVWHLGQIVRGRFSRRWLAVVVAFGAGGLLFLPWIGNLLRSFELTRERPRAQANPELLWITARDTFLAFSNLGVALFALLAFFSLRNRRAWYAWGLFLLLLPLNLVAYYILSVNELRYSLTLLPLLAVIAGFGIAELARQRVPAILVIVIWAAGAISVEGNFGYERLMHRWPPQPMREMAQVLENRAQEGDVIVNLVDSDNIPDLAQYVMAHYMIDLGARLEIAENRYIPGAPQFAERLRRSVGDSRHIWLVADPRWQIEESTLVDYVLYEESIYPCATLADEPTMIVRAYGRVDREADAWRFGDGIRVMHITPAQVRNGILQVWVAFEVAENVPPSTYSVGLHVVDANGGLQAQLDSGLPGVGVSCRYVEIPVGGLAPGEYNLHGVVYGWQDQARLEAVAPDGTVSDYPVMQRITLP
ncbi:MAG: glycosyltransferase family 39 protein [bacterium]|nr:glycosyltransferase family 39 protein [bacterium]